MALFGQGRALRSALVAAIAATSGAEGRPDTRWDSAPVVIQRWFQDLMQPDHPRQSCCGEADAFEADVFEVEGDHYVAIITDGRGVFPAGRRIPVPNSKMKFDSGNPTGHGLIFIGPSGQIYCYVTPGGA